MDPLDTVRRRLAEQHLAGEPFPDVATAAGWLGAMQAQEYAEAKWSLAERTRDCVEADVEAAVDRGDIIRTHVLRPTWHFVASQDLRWLLRLSRSRVHAMNRYHYRQCGLDATMFVRAHGILARSLGAGRSLTRREIAAQLAGAGLPAAGLPLAYLLMHAELEALICNGPRRGRQQTYALVDDRVPASPLDGLAGDAAFDMLVLRYFLSHGPATIRDFTSWSSFTVTDTKAALERVGTALSCTAGEDGTAWYAAAERRRSSARAAGAYLIPTYDETIVAYQDLRVVLAHKLPREGSLLRCIVIDGRTHGSWQRTVAARSVSVEARLFSAIGGAEARALDEAVARFGSFLGLPATLDVRLA